MLKSAKIIGSLLISCLLLSAQQVRIKNITLYLPHSQSQKLVCEDYCIPLTANDDMAEVIFDVLKEKSKSPGYINLFAEASSAAVVNDTAVVEMKPTAIPRGLDALKAEYLTIYSVANSLTSTGEITTVRFTQNGQPQKNYHGFTDMRETFIPDYDICS